MTGNNTFWSVTLIDGEGMSNKLVRVCEHEQHLVTCSDVERSPMYNRVYYVESKGSSGGCVDE